MEPFYELLLQVQDTYGSGQGLDTLEDALRLRFGAEMLEGSNQYHCSKCDATEGVFEGDVTQPDSLVDAFAGVTTVVIAVGSPGGSSKAQIEAIEAKLPEWVSPVSWVSIWGGRAF